MKTAQYTFLLIMFFTLSNCVQKTHLKTIHFRVDMKGIENPSDVGIRGEFGSDPWNETIYLNDDNSDGVFEGTVTKQTGQNSVWFKFVNHHSQFELSGQDNRGIRFEYKPETIIYEATFNDSNAKVEVAD